MLQKWTRNHLSTPTIPGDRPKTILQSLRILAALTFLTGGLVIVAGTNAQRMFVDSVLVGRSTRPDIIKTGETRVPNLDIRLTNEVESVLEKHGRSDIVGSISRAILAGKSEIENGYAELKARRHRAAIEYSPLTGAVEIVRSDDGLTNAAPDRSGEEIVRDFLLANKALYGLDDNDIANLNFIGESVSPGSGLRMVRVEQIVNGRPVFQSESRFILDRYGRLFRSLGLIVPNATQIAEPLEGLIAPQEALRLTMSEFGSSLDESTMTVLNSDDNGNENLMLVADPNVIGEVTSKLVYFPIAPGELIPAWSQIVFGPNDDWYVVVDARNGTQLWRKSIRDDASTHDARFRVYVQADGTTPADSPAPQSPSAAAPGAGTQFAGIAPTIVSMFLAQDITASPNGWIDDCPGGVCSANETQTLGNNALVCVDRGGTANVCDTDAAGIIDGNGRPTGNADINGRNRDFLGVAPRDYQTNYLPPPQGGNPEAGQTATGAGLSGTNAFDQFRRGSVTQQFYVTNWYHDKLFALGFNTAAANFQNNNFGGGGVGNDRVLVDVQDGSGTNNANFSTPPDGSSGRSQMYIFTGPTIDRDGGLDSEILIHELTHGTSNRLIGNAAGLQWSIGGGMGEGWSDFYALSLLNNTNADNPNSNYASGAYATYKIGGLLDNYVYGIRRFPYSTNNAVNPLTWADVDQTTYDESGGIAVSPLNFGVNGALEVHNVGEIWANTLWEMRSRIIADPAGANGNVPTGNQTSLQLVTDAMKMTPINPTFIQARDALVDADCAANACANEQAIWAAFADRGLGYGAYAPVSVQFGLRSGHIGIRESFNTPNLDLNTVTIDDSLTNNTGFIDPGEPVRININLKNPWRNASKSATGITATISSSTPGVNIYNGTTTYPDIGPNGNADRNGTFLRIGAPLAGTCGGSINLTLTIASSLGVVARDFSLRMGQPSGTLAPVTYTRSAVGLAIPDGNGRGVVDSMSVSDDYEIADINVRIDSLTHTWDGDVTVGIRGPNGYGTDLVSLTGWMAGGVFTNFGSQGDNYTNTVIDDEAANGLVQATSAQAPYTGNWKPTFNSPGWVGLIGANPDSNPHLGSFDGTSTFGTWKMVVSDWTSPDSGTLNGWSLIITPRAFVCTGFVPTAAHVTVSGFVRDEIGRPVVNATIALIPPDGQIRYSRSNSFGYFMLNDVEVGRTYLLRARAKGYSFMPQAVMVEDEVTDLEIVAEGAR